MLSRLQCRRFFFLLDALLSYAGERLGVTCADQMPEGDARVQVAREVWRTPDIIGDFVSDNPAGLSEGEMATVARWRDGLTDLFIVDFFPDGITRFVNGGYAFTVEGFARDIVERISSLPAAVETTLLPFDGLIVYADYLIEHAIDFGDGMLDVFEDETAQIYHEGRIVRTGDELAALMADRSLDESAGADGDWRFGLEMADPSTFPGEEGRADGGHGDDHWQRGCSCGHEHQGGLPGAGPDASTEGFDEEDCDTDAYVQHVGVLAGLSFEEREREIERHMLEADELMKGQLIDLLDDDCSDIELTRNLSELLASEDRVDVRRFAGYLGVSDIRALDDPGLRTAIVERVADSSAVQRIVEELSEYHIAALHQLAERGGLMSVDESEVASLRDLPVHELGLSYVFHDGRTFSFVMPDEICAIADAIDWDGAIDKARRYRELLDLADDVAELRGIAPVADVISEYRRCHPEGFSSGREIVPYLLQGVADGAANFELLELPTHELYLLHFELFWAYEKVMGIEESPYVAEPVTHGELGEMLADLLAQQKGIEPRALDEEMLEARTLLDWKMRRPSVRNLCAYLDAHVPANCDDFYFADKVVEEILADAMWGLMNRGAQPLFDMLESNGFVPEPDQMQELIDLWVDVTSDLPSWPNNGWSLNELDR